MPNVNYFATEPIGDKLVTEIPGVGEVIGKQLADAGFDRASTLLGQYLILKRNRAKFDKWFKETCKATSREADSCFNSLDQWCLRFLY